MAILEFYAKLEVGRKELDSSADLALPIVFLDFDKWIVEILRGILLRLQVNGILHAKKRIGRKVIVTLGPELEHHGEL